MTVLRNIKALKPNRRSLRHRETDTERMLWQFLRDRRLDGFKFYRQYSVGPYVADFYCPKSRLLIELDGGHHAEEDQQDYDTQRSEYLNSLDIRVLRFWNSDVQTNIEGVMETITGALKN